MPRVHKNNTAAFKAQRLRVLRRDAYTCYYCGDAATHADHVIPKAMGGGDELDNLVAACASCNQRKGSKPQGLFLATNSAPPVFSERIYQKTAVRALQGPCMGQESQDKT